MHSYVYPTDHRKIPRNSLYYLPPLPKAVMRQITDGTIFREFLDALQGFAGGNTSWNVGAVRACRTKIQCCFVLNFVLPAVELPIRKCRNYIIVSALMYVRVGPAGKEPFILLISDTDALDQIIRDTVIWAKSECPEYSVQIHKVIHNYLAQISTKGFSGILLALEYRVRIHYSSG